MDSHTPPRTEKSHPDQEDHSSLASREKDAGAAIVPHHAAAIDKAAERRVLRKIDLFLIPVMWMGYGLVYYDKVSSNTISLTISLTISRPSSGAPSSLA